MIKHPKICKQLLWRLIIFRHGSCLTRIKKALCTRLCAKGECLAVPPFLMLRFYAYLMDPLTEISRESLLIFSLPVQKLPSIPAFLQIPLSLLGISLWRCPGMYSSFSQPFLLWISNHSARSAHFKMNIHPPANKFACSVFSFFYGSELLHDIISEDFSFVKEKFSSFLQCRPRFHLFPVSFPQKRE